MMSSSLRPSTLTCWRRLHTDTCLLRSLFDVGHLTLPDEKTAMDCISRLDRAIIISGAAGDGRLDLILDIIERIQSQCLLRELFQVPESLSMPTLCRQAATLESSSKKISCLQAPSFLTFQSRLYRHPFILRGYAHDWPALQEHPWSSVQYLRSVAGPGRVVPVEVGADYRSDTWTQKIMNWDEFLASLDPPDEQPTAKLFYLAQHNLFAQFPALKADVMIPDYAYSCLPSPDDCPAYKPPGNDEQLVINVWLGPKGTISPAHTVSTLGP